MNDRKATGLALAVALATMVGCYGVGSYTANKGFVEVQTDGMSEQEKHYLEMWFEEAE